MKFTLGSYLSGRHNGHFALLFACDLDTNIKLVLKLHTHPDSIRDAPFTTGLLVTDQLRELRDFLNTYLEEKDKAE